jgi:hypothetical protein
MAHGERLHGHVKESCTTTPLSTLGVHVRRARSIFSKALNFRCSDFKSNLLPDAKVAIVPAGTSFPAVLREPFDPLLLVTRQSPSSTS